MSKLKEFLKWHLDNPHNLNFKMIVSYEEREETMKEMQGVVNILDTGLTPDEINALRERDTAKEPEEIRDAFGDGRLICPNCRNSVINYFNRSRPPRFCMICGQRLQWEE